MSEEQQVPPSPPAGSSAVPPPPPAAGASPNRTPMIVLSYFWILALVPLVLEKDDKDIQWHAKHGLVLTAAELLLGVALGMVQFLLGLILGPLSCVISIIILFIALALVVFHVMCMVKGINGERLLVPGISEYADRF